MKGARDAPDGGRPWPAPPMAQRAVIAKRLARVDGLTSAVRFSDIQGHGRVRAAAWGGGAYPLCGGCR
jgi:hypothetical protein